MDGEQVGSWLVALSLPIGALPSGGDFHDRSLLAEIIRLKIICRPTVFYIPFDSLKFAAFCCDLRIVCTGNKT
jgi:hypothetical protein